MASSVKNKSLVFLLLFVSELLVGVTLAVEQAKKKGFSTTDWVSQPFADADHETIIGIDLGTTYSRVGVYQNDNIVIITDSQGNGITPSWVEYNNSEPLIRKAAKNRAVLDLESATFYVKRFLGRKFPELQNDLTMMPFKVVNKEWNPYIYVEMKNNEQKLMSPEEIISIVFRKMRQKAESYLGTDINRAVVTVPASVYLNEETPQAIKDAGSLAGLDIASIINEPLAAMLGYGLDILNNKEGDSKILVFNLGSGTFDVSIMALNNGWTLLLATRGDAFVGGEEFDYRVMDYFINLIKKKYNKNISNDKYAIGKLKKECERAKIALSNQGHVLVKIESLFDGIDFSEPLSRSKFEELNIDLFNKTMELMKQALKDSKLEKKEIDEIIFVGGSTRIPKVEELVKDFFDGKEPLRGRIDLDEIVVHGAAIWGAVHGSYIGKPRFSIINECVCASVGIETVGGVITGLIRRCNPGMKTQIFTTSRDQQTSVSIRIYGGDWIFNHELGRFNLSGIAPAPRGIPQIEVTLTVTPYGILHATAMDRASKKSNAITITKTWFLDEEEQSRRIKEMERMVVQDDDDDLMSLTQTAESNEKDCCEEQCKTARYYKPSQLFITC